eukprot:TRINITY_DN39027_c0_g1_i1.p2 TRINITY_DN39027_c0_g1~~TRINITY_DN39027_c0_g1_i1.p2  ORF type:complete len:606 (+),score=274.77 TRINITY_DN39027_c0_g1_i1:61-1878(+)
MNAVLRHVRKEMAHHNLAVYIIPSGDPHASEYTPAAFQRVTAVSNFSGSAGTAVVTPEKAYLWTDSRYWLQAGVQLSDSWELKKPTDQTLEAWLGLLEGNARVGLDPFVFPVSRFERMKKAVALNKAELVTITDNLVDLGWADRPQLPSSRAFILGQQYTGMSAKEKLENVRKNMVEKKASSTVFATLDDIAWMLNIRGSDIRCTPVVLSYAIVTEDTVHLFVDQSRFADEVTAELAPLVTFHPYADILAAIPSVVGKRALYDENVTSYALVSALKAACEAVHQNSVVQKAKTVKNATEAEGFIRCHVRDGVALSKFLKWLEEEIAAGRPVTEITAVDKLLTFRQQQAHFIEESFVTISCSGPNGASIHYRPTPEAHRSLAADELYLVDSGGQYFDGTTDVTRTICFSTPKPKEVEAYTLVLKGVIGISTAKWPKGTMGHRLDTLARHALWQQGLDYGHGTGHGVGHFLGVHEGPIMISSGAPSYQQPMDENCVVSNEPGYYEDGAFGIRIENLELVVKAETKYRFLDKQFLTMRPLTMAPLEARLIDPSLLTDAELDWVNAYHRTVLKALSEADSDASFLEWLAKKCETIGREDGPSRKRGRTA